MPHDPIPDLLAQVSSERLRAHLFYLAKDPLPYRKANFTLPGHSKSTLDEADDYIQAQLEVSGYEVEREPCQVQAFRRDLGKPKAHQYATPAPDDPWYTAYNLYAKRADAAGTGAAEIVLAIAHKDSQSWIDSPGAYDNAAGTAALLEIARLLRHFPARRALWFVFCNEEHTPWTSVTAARRARERNDNIVALFNTDSLGGKSVEQIAAGLATNATQYSSPEGERLAKLMAEVNDTYHLGLVQTMHYTETPGDDHGSYFKEGYRAVIANVGSIPYADPEYHLESDTAEHVDLRNLELATKAVLAAMARELS